MGQRLLTAYKISLLPFSLLKESQSKWNGQFTQVKYSTCHLAIQSLLCIKGHLYAIVLASKPLLLDTFPERKNAFKGTDLAAL